MTASFAPGYWRSDLTHSSVAFAVAHLGLSRIRGRVGEFETQLFVDEDGVWSRAALTLVVTSIDTNDMNHDSLLLSMDFFDVETHPPVQLQSTSITQTGTSYSMVGNLVLMFSNSKQD